MSLSTVFSLYTHSSEDSVYSKNTSNTWPINSMVSQSKAFGNDKYDPCLLRRNSFWLAVRSEKGIYPLYWVVFHLTFSSLFIVSVRESVCEIRYDTG